MSRFLSARARHDEIEAGGVPGVSAMVAAIGMCRLHVQLGTVAGEPQHASLNCSVSHSL